MTPLRQRLIEHLPLRGMSERTHALSVRAVRPLAAHDHKPPERITEAERRDYCLDLKNVPHYSRSATTIAWCGIQFFYEQTRKRAWTPLTFVRPPRDQKLPVILSPDAVRTLLAPLQLLRYRVCLTTLYACGLRLQAGTHRQGPDMDSARLLVHVRGGKGAQDREVPLPPRTLAWLRQAWSTPRPPLGRLPAPGRSGLGMATATVPMPRTRVQDACRAALKASGIQQRASVHTLRHSEATQLLEVGGHRRLMQDSLGHDSPTTTALYTPLTATADARARDALTGRMDDR